MEFGTSWLKIFKWITAFVHFYREVKMVQPSHVHYLYDYMSLKNLTFRGGCISKKRNNNGKIYKGHIAFKRRQIFPGWASAANHE